MPASTEFTALIVALVALIISLLQVIQQYASSSQARSKVSRAAIGPMARKNKYSWSFREWKLRIRYARVDSRAMINALEARDRSAEEEFHLALPDYYFTWEMESAAGPMKVKVFRRGDEKQMPVQISGFDQEKRAVIAKLKKSLAGMHTRTAPCKATWCNMITDLGIDPREFPTKEYLDADTVATALDAPTIYIKMSDLILFGFLLNMEICRCDIGKLAIDMVGKDCNITTEYQGAAGMISRYSGLSLEIQPSVMNCKPAEISMLLRTASGIWTIGDSEVEMHQLGYSAIDFLFSRIITKLSGPGDNDDWREVKIEDLIEDMGPDIVSRGEEKWHKPTVPVVPFLLAFGGNLSVICAFPHCNLQPWDNQDRTSSSRSACLYLESTVRFVEAPWSIFKNMEDRKVDLVVMSDYRCANNWGCERGGMRSWLAGNMASFAKRISQCWDVSEASHQVPVLPHLLPHLRKGTLDVELVRESSAPNHPGKFGGAGWWWTQSNALFWLQIMMFDAWIAHRVSMIMKKDGDISVPVDVLTATSNAELEKNKQTATGWRKSRLEFGRAYLQRLAEGRNGVGASFMSVGQRHGDGWCEMLFGKASDWAEIDAVLTLRAIVMVVRLELMKDSTALLDLRRLDPLVQMA